MTPTATPWRNPAPIRIPPRPRLAASVAPRLVETRTAFLASVAGPGYEVRNLGTGIVGATGAGVASALLGVGGGIIKVPLMNLAMGVPLRVATATSNLMIGITAAASAVIYLLRGEIDPYVAGPTAIGVFVGATLGFARLASDPAALPALAVRRGPPLHRVPDAPAGRGMTGAPDTDPRVARGREFDRFIGRLLIGVTYVAVVLLSVGVVLLFAERDLAAVRRAAARPARPRRGPHGAGPGRVPVARHPGRHRDAAQPRHRRARSGSRASVTAGWSRSSIGILVVIALGVVTALAAG